MEAKKIDFIPKAKLVHQLGLIWGRSGNMSVRFRKNSFLITAAGAAFDRLKTNDIVECSIYKESFWGKKKPSLEHKMHRVIYQTRKDIKFILHTHPFFTILLSAAQGKFRINIVPEAAVWLKKLKILPYIKPGTVTLAKRVKKEIKKAEVIILRSHGIIATGRNFEEVLEQTEAIEFIAKLNVFGKIMGVRLASLC